MVDQIKADHRDDLSVCEKTSPKNRVGWTWWKKKTFFNDAWDYLQGRFPHLRQFCGDPATAFPNTTLVGSDFSIVSWEKDNAGSSLTGLALAGIMQAKQYDC